MNQVAKIAGINRMAVSFIESGARIPSIATYARLALALDVSPAEMLCKAEQATAALQNQRPGKDSAQLSIEQSSSIQLTEGV